ncbi:carbohydrate ABC transporter permease [Paenibacillus caseinilyticus]|uniref:Maltose/maltodextrin transport system permease protein n=1 Tax=Paenibacillus mucilaginosus K02 TaxID=997761 RepID=I0BKW3_9BACL|nr:ABC transporter permease subunit [Paenibacillus mucilaginosus]AFH63010.2 ABC transporter permease [Paenibacillus mucilaginosus K02]
MNWNRSTKAAALSALWMGAGQLYNRQYMKGLTLTAVGAAAVSWGAAGLIRRLHGLITLGTTPRQMVKTGNQFRMTDGDHSIFLMIDGLIALMILLLLAGLYVFSIRDAKRQACRTERGERLETFRESLLALGGRHFPYLILALPLIAALFLSVLPLLFSILLAFTDFAAPNLPPAKLVNWVGLQNFTNLISLRSWSRTFFGVFGWTVIWTLLSTVTTYFGGMVLAVLIHQPDVKFKALWRTLLVIPFALPNLVSLLIFRNLLNNQFGPVNQTLRVLGLEGLPWLTDPFWAKVTVLAVNMWIGVPLSMILISGVLTTIPRDLYEAATVDGASAWQRFSGITLPLVLFTTAPILIMQFAGNFNNFNVIFLLTEGNPAISDYQYAGGTDLLVTWLYKLTLNNRQYNMAAVIGILIFIIVASLSIINYRRSRSYREEEMSA